MISTSTSHSPSSIDLDTFRRYAGLSLPRHVSYPMPTWWQDADESLQPRVRAALAAADRLAGRDEG